MEFILIKDKQDGLVPRLSVLRSQQGKKHVILSRLRKGTFFALHGTFGLGHHPGRLEFVKQPVRITNIQDTTWELYFAYTETDADPIRDQ